MRRRDCSEADNEHGWLPYNHPEGCPVIVEQDPHIVQYDYADTVMVSGIGISVSRASVLAEGLRMYTKGFWDAAVSSLLVLGDIVN